MQHVKSFAPIENADAKILILGSMPGETSLRADQYYAHPATCSGASWANWSVLPPNYLTNNGYRRSKRHISRCGMCSVHAAAKAASTPILTTVRSSPTTSRCFFRQHPEITHVFFNGSKAEQCYRKHVPRLPQPATSNTCACRPPARRMPPPPASANWSMAGCSKMPAPNPRRLPAHRLKCAHSNSSRLLRCAPILFATERLLCCRFRQKPVPANLEPLPPPPAFDAAPDGAPDDEPQVTITKQTEQTVEEFRAGGKLYMIKVTPKIGALITWWTIRATANLRAREP